MKKRTVLSIIIIFCIIAAIVFMGKKKKDEVVIYGVVTYADTEGSPQMVINSPRTGHVLIPSVIDEITYYEETLWGELEEGDLIEVTFPKDNFGIMEVYPGVFSNDAKKMVIKGKGFAMKREANSLFSFAIPEGLVPGAGIGDVIEFSKIVDT